MGGLRGSRRTGDFALVSFRIDMSDSSSPRPPEQQVATRVAQNYLTLGWDAEVLSNERNVFVYLPKQRRIELVLDDPPE